MTWKISSKCTPASASPSAARLGIAAAAAALLWQNTARAQSFPYVDRQGRVHLISTPDAPAPDAPGSPPVEPDRARPAPPAAPGPWADRPPARPRPEAAARHGGAAAAPAIPAGHVPYLDIVQAAAAHYSLPPELVLAVMRVESAFDPRAVSRSGAMGLMQLMPATASDMLVTDPFDPWQSISGGARFLRILVNRFDGNVVLALAGYNAGPGAVERWGGIPPYPETVRYVGDVLAIYHQLLWASHTERDGRR